jgi:hypothetical protein
VDPSVIVTAVRIATAFSNPQNVQNPIGAVDAASESEWANTELLMWRTLKWFKMFGWVAPFVGSDLV